ncbi:hypothetical protein B479_00125 [Pseudomonas putida HB3267]|nr:hypothetical protein B479_00125 [Pseudomonas putida HB3267]
MIARGTLGCIDVIAIGSPATSRSMAALIAVELIVRTDSRYWMRGLPDKSLSVPRDFALYLENLFGFLEAGLVER